MKSASGSGRGRGWIKISSDTENGRPGGTPSTNIANSVSKLNIEENDTKNVSEKQQFLKVIHILEQFNPKDDGILLNQKLKHLIKVWPECCKSANEINTNFRLIYLQCLQDSSLATKVVTVMTSLTFQSQTLHDVKLRNLFVTSLQRNYEDRESLQKDNALVFRNFVWMLCEFFHKARLCDGSNLRILKKPILDCLEMLIKKAQPEDIELFTTMLYLTGSSFEATHLEVISSLLMQVRKLLINDKNLTDVCRTWLLLALDVTNNRFGILPSDIHKFYEEELGEEAMAHFQGTHNILSIDTSYPSKSLDKYQSSVSVLQVTPPESTSPVEQWNVASNNNSSHLTGESRRVGRPILGVGARSQSNGEHEEWYSRRK